MKIRPDTIVDKLYDIALDPHELEGLIDVWTDAGLDDAQARATVETIDRFDELHEAHLLRAHAFLERGEAADGVANLSSVLDPFENLAAFIVDDIGGIQVSNVGAMQAFMVQPGRPMLASALPLEVKDALEGALSEAFANDDEAQIVVKAQFTAEESPLVMQVRRLATRLPDSRALALVVTTSYRWNETLGPMLGEVFKLTLAEQGVVRSLVEGQNVKEIALSRDTSEGTVRGQLKSILSKMNARSQSEIIRLVVHLQSVSKFNGGVSQPVPSARAAGTGWLDAEVWKPFKTLNLPDGRRMDYHEMGPANGAPVLYSHMGYCMARWHAPMVKRAFEQELRVICPIRAGFGQSDNLQPDDDVLRATRSDTLFLMDTLNLGQVPYVVQGNDLVFAMDLAGKHPDRISEIIGLGARPYLYGDLQYAGMSKWHRFFISTAKHSPHLLRFTARAWMSLMRRIGGEAIFRNAHKGSRGDMSMGGNRPLIDVMLANSELVASKTADASQAYTMELIVTESPWDHLIHEAREIKTRFFCGTDDPLMDVATIAGYRDAYPWIDIEVIQGGGQMLIYQHFERIIPEIAAAAKLAQRPKQRQSVPA